MSALLPMDSEISTQENSDQETNPTMHQTNHNESGNDANIDVPSENETIDNPYLMPAKIAKKKWR